MTPDEFRQHGHEVVEWIADYLETIRDRPVLSGAAPGELTAALPALAPEEPEPMDRILSDFRERIVPANTHWNHPSFHAWFANSGSPPAILGEALCAALNVNGMVWKSSPACTELEQVTLRWLAQWMGMPDAWFGTIHDTASTAGVHVLACARMRSDASARTRGNYGAGFTVYCSELAHSFVDKAAITVGFGLDAVRRVPVDEAFAIQPRALAEMIAADRAAGLKPACLVATVGTTGVASIDPVPELAAIAAREKLWLHVDAAYGGAAAVSTRYRHYLAGAERADSFVVNPHKWLLTTSDLCAFYTSDPATLRAAFGLVPEYLRTAEHPAAVNMMDYSFQLGRRFRALKLWFVMRSYGRKGVAAMIESHCAMATDFAARLESTGRFEIAAPIRFSLVCFRYRGSDDDNRQLLEAINASGQAFLSHTVLAGRYVLRMAIGNWQTSPADMARLFSLVERLAADL
jgi:aromatic-L-amino-acid/L-tryptophan decarboxylase